ncbi:thioredoxin domain-containing protein [Candidatus Saccharibacteria bacterium]|nr:thioredoxin domain-containing protein [Candidatus Saccharibacteria bacterium]
MTTKGQTTKSSKGWIVLWLVIGVAVVALLVFATKTILENNNKYAEVDFNSVIAASEANGNIGDHIKGDKNSPVKIYEYADFQCPGCASINPRIKKIIENLGGKLAVVYRSYILSYHENGTAAAAAAEAAGLQGFWEEYGDMLFAKQAEWQSTTSEERTALFTKYFDEVTKGKGDKDKFVADMGSPEVSKKIKYDMGIGKKIDIPATPAFYIDGQYIKWSDAGSVKVNGKEITWDSARSGDSFEELIKEIVNAKLEEGSTE